ncbi:hypothetical protein [Nostoc sp. PCC 7107]|uniref:hypothetical protein n=1 Tax=Nostoc sp. PCC 7107 TaxID=317936 RepID=UPI00030C9D6A
MPLVEVTAVFTGGLTFQQSSLALGEKVAISLLRDERLGYNEDFPGFTFTKFDCTRVTV